MLKELGYSVCVCIAYYIQFQVLSPHSPLHVFSMPLVHTQI